MTDPEPKGKGDRSMSENRWSISGVEFGVPGDPACYGESWIA